MFNTKWSRGGRVLGYDALIRNDAFMILCYLWMYVEHVTMTQCLLYDNPSTLSNKIPNQNIETKYKN